MIHINAIDYSIYKVSFKEIIKLIVVGGIFSCFIIYMFYHSIVLSILLCLPSQVLIIKLYENHKVRQRKEILACEFEEMLQCIASALSTGYSVENAFGEAKRELSIMYNEDSYILKELNRICASFGMNITVEELIIDLAKRSGVEDIYSFADILVIAKRSGGDLIAIVKQTANIMHDKKEINEDVKTMIAAKRYENRIMSLMPAAMLLYLTICSPGYLAPLYGNPAGSIIMTICLIIYMLSYMWGTRIMNIGTSIRCKRPTVKDRTSKRSLIYRIIEKTSLRKIITDISIKIKTLYIDIDEYDVAHIFWNNISRIIEMSLVSNILFIIYGIVCDNSNLPFILMISLTMLICIPAGRIKQVNKMIEKRNQQMLLDYPELINKFSLLLGAGITTKGVWIRIVDEYMHKKKTNQIEMHYIYEEMKYSLGQINNGLSENSVYEKFGRRIRLLPYMKFGTMLSQNLRKGNRNMLDQLCLTSIDALVQRKDAMKRLGEEASSKLLFPMLIQFMLILVIIMYPALITI